MIAYVGGGAHLPTFTDLKKLKPLSMSINVLAAAGDVLISVAICFFLNNAKSGFAWSNNVINRLVRLIASITFALMITIMRHRCCSPSIPACSPLYVPARPFFSYVKSCMFYGKRAAHCITSVDSRSPQHIGLFRILLHEYAFE